MQMTLKSTIYVNVPVTEAQMAAAKLVSWMCRAPQTVDQQEPSKT